MEANVPETQIEIRLEIQELLKNLKDEDGNWRDGSWEVLKVKLEEAYSPLERMEIDFSTMLEVQRYAELAMLCIQHLEEVRVLDAKIEVCKGMLYPRIYQQSLHFLNSVISAFGSGREFTCACDILGYLNDFSYKALDVPRCVKRNIPPHHISSATH